MLITELKKYKGTTYEAELDYERRIYLHIDIIADFGLKKGMEIDRQHLKRIIYASNFRRAYQYALYCLDYRDYSAEELFEKLVKTYKSEPLCLEVIKKLAKAGLVNDRRYGEKLARRLVEVKKYGYYRARREMTAKGLDSDLAEELLGVCREQFHENLLELIGSKYGRRLTDSTDRAETEKVKAALARYGYGFDEINRAIKEYFETEGDL